MKDEELWKGRDALTGLPDMHTFLEETYKRADEDIAAGTFPTCASVCFNISNFRQYNNIHGMDGGDLCLKKVAQILTSVLGEGMVCREGGDIFLSLIRKEEAVRRVEEVCDRVNDLIGNPGIMMKAGIRILGENEHSRKHLYVVFDQAKMACDSIKGDRSRRWAFYSDEMGKLIEEKNYILENFERALKEGKIRVCFQPVVRSLTGKFCGSEALSRWIDPEHGNIRPDIFVKVLEDARLVHRLDTFVLRKVAQVLRFELDNGIPAVPVSINFSRLDFSLMDPFKEVEKTVREFDLPRSLICIEITETALLEDKSLLADSVRLFRRAGYQVWLDDFGSGYSSLNVLQNFPLDEIKLDIAFLRNYSEKSKILIKSIILMAKTLGLHTLAEGVETKEQADFLISVGCEKMQGYYYAKPMYLDAAVSYPGEKQMEVETPEEKELLDHAGTVNVITDSPVALSIFDGKVQKLLFANEAYMASLALEGRTSIDEINQALRKDERPQSESFKILAENARRKGKDSLVYLEHGCYMRLELEKISEAGGWTLFRESLENLNVKKETANLASYDRKMRQFMSLYSGLYYFDAKKQETEIIQSSAPGFFAGTHVPYSSDWVEAFSQANVHPEDQERYKSFLDVEKIYEQAEKSAYSEAVTMIREKKQSGGYRWMLYDAVVVPRDGRKDILLAVREDMLDGMKESAEIFREYAEWKNSRSEM